MEILWDALQPRTIYRWNCYSTLWLLAFGLAEKVKSSVWHSLLALSRTRLTATWTRLIKTRTDLDWRWSLHEGAWWPFKLSKRTQSAALLSFSDWPGHGAEAAGVCVQGQSCCFNSSWALIHNQVIKAACLTCMGGNVTLCNHSR